MALYLREWRKQKGFTLEELTEAAEIGYTTLVRAEKGQQNPTVETVEKIAQALGIGPGKLFEPPPEKQPARPNKRRKGNGKRKR